MSDEGRKLYEAVRAEPERLRVSLVWDKGFKRDAPARSNLVLHSGEQNEPAAIVGKLPDEQARRVIDALAGVGYFDRVTVYIAEKGAMPLEPMPAEPPGYLLFVQVQTDKQHQSKLAMFEDLGGDERTRHVLVAMGNALTGEPATAIAKVLAQLPAATTAATQPGDENAEIGRLIEQLAGETFAAREDAQKALVKIGLPALAALQEAASDRDAERAGRAKAAIKQIEEEAWGPANEGLSARLLPLRSLLKAGQSPELTLEVRNRGQRAVEISSAVMVYCQVQVDGAWYSWAKSYGGSWPTLMLDPGKDGRLKVRLTDDWAIPANAAPGAAAADARWLELSPGGHVVRVSFTGYPQLGRREGGVRCESNPVQVEIEPPPMSQPADPPTAQAGGT